MIAAVARSQVEREKHFAALRQLLADCTRGQGTLVIIRGPVACGKTWLLDSFAEAAGDHGAVVLTAMAVRGENVRPFSLVQELLAGVTDDLGNGQAVHEAARLADAAVRNDRVTRATMGLLTRTLLDMATPERPLVLCADDVDYADRASLSWLEHVARHLRSEPALLLVTESALADAPRSGGEIDLLRRRQHHVLNVGPFSTAGITGLLERELATADAALLAPAVAKLTGGNPLLVSGLVEDGVVAGTGGLVAGTVYRRAVRACLERIDTATRRVGEALALLDGGASDSRIGRLLDLYPGSVAHARQALTAAGLVDSAGGWRPEARTAVLEAMPTGARAQLHGRAARLLYGDGASPVEVSRHLSGSDSLDAPWTMTVFAAAADEAKTEPDVLDLLQCLRGALTVAADDRQRAELTTLVVGLEWRVAPELAYRRIPDLGEAVLRGHLRGAPAAQVVLNLLWSGQLSEAVAVLQRLLDDCELSAIGPALLTGWMWMSVLYPGELAFREMPTPPTALTTHPRIQLIAALGAWMCDDLDEDAALSLAKQILRTARPEHAALGSILTALAILISADCTEDAAPLCDVLLAETELPTSAALLQATRAAIHLRQNEFADAEVCAGAALDLISVRSWGIGIGAPLSVLVLAAVGTGRLDAALEYLSTPVPDSMFQTVLALPYLYARGHFHLATASYASALSDFQNCADLMQRWGIDRPTFLPWRTTLAQAYLGLGEVEKARELVDEQLTRLHPRHGRARGRTLQLRAATDDAARDRGTHDDADTEDLGPDGDQDAELTRAEQRVASLAVQGYTNRQIATMLYVTSSTVEQHLTRVFRKLNISKRTALATRLESDGERRAG
jgi:DNA-binding CsgD family transcriptional regulator